MDLGFRRPRDGRPTRHLYLANCGEARGDTPSSVLEFLRELAPGVNIEDVHVGSAGVSYVSFSTADEAQDASARLRDSARRWIVRYAERSDAAVPQCILPDSVASTESIEVPGMTIVPNFVDEEVAQALLAAVDSQPWDTSIRRRVQHYGHAFDYSRLRLAEGRHIEALPDFCAGLLDRIVRSDLLPQPPDQLTVNEYQPGVGIALHVDAHSSFEDGIAALTLGAGIVMEFRRPEADAGGKVSVGKHHRLSLPPSNSKLAEQKNVWLPANSLLILRGESRYSWQHGIAWRKTDCICEGQAVPRGRRVSFTFRSVRHRPCDCQWPLMCDTQNPEAHALPSRLGQASEEPGLPGG
mmetsp:Transcript_13542/g.32341  ORF Transcript_13542/g.32341 Transcript_13542/m.32341 type:complete len:353 (+) Transcript_13542:1-1059(+)